MLETFEKLVKEKSCVIAPGVEIRCGQEINISVFFEDGDTVVKFGSPSIQVHITKMGPMKLLNIVRPTITQIRIKEKSFVICLDNAPDIEVDRESMVH